MGGKRNIRRGINRPSPWGFFILSSEFTQGGPSGRRTQFVDIKSNIPPQNKLLILKRNPYSISTKGCLRTDGPPCKAQMEFNSICSSQVSDAREPDEGVGDADDGEGPPEPTAAERRPHPGQLRSHAGGRGPLGRRLGPDYIG